MLAWCGPPGSFLFQILRIENLCPQKKAPLFKLVSANLGVNLLISPHRILARIVRLSLSKYFVEMRKFTVIAMASLNEALSGQKLLACLCGTSTTIWCASV